MEIIQVDLIRNGFPLDMFDRMTTKRILRFKTILDEIRKAEMPEDS